MATITSRSIIDEIIRGNGFYPGDEVAVVKVVEYTVQGGRTMWGVIYEGEDLHRYSDASEYRTNPKTIWTRA